MGNALQHQGKIENAIEAYRAAISFNPRFAEAYNNIGNCFKEIGKLTSARQAYNRAILIFDIHY